MDNNLYLLEDNSFKILDFLNDEEELKFEQNYLEACEVGDFSFSKLFKGHFQSESAGDFERNDAQRLNEDLIHRVQTEEDPDMMFENVDFKNIRK